MSEYLNLEALQRGMCGPTSDWIMVIPEVKAALARIAALEAQLAEKERVNAALLLKYHRVRENVRNISRTLRDRRANDYRKRYSALMHVCEQLTFAAGKMVQKTDDFTWIRMTKPDYDQYREWLAASRESKEASAPTNDKKEEKK